MTKHFQSTKKQSTNDMTVNDLNQFLQNYVAALFPGSAIDYWGKMDNKDEKLIGLGSFGAHHVACYVKKGGSEGEIIHVRAILNNGLTQEIARAKSFGPTEENWAIAMAISEAMEELYACDDIPLLAEFVDKLPETPTRMSCDTGHEINFFQDDSSLEVVLNGTTIANYDFAEKGPNAKIYVANYLTDWKNLANNIGIEIVDSEKESESPGI